MISKGIGSRNKCAMNLAAFCVRSGSFSWEISNASVTPRSEPDGTCPRSAFHLEIEFRDCFSLLDGQLERLAHRDCACAQRLLKKFQHEWEQCLASFSSVMSTPTPFGGHTAKGAMRRGQRWKGVDAKEGKSEPKRQEGLDQHEPQERSAAVSAVL
jgi:hypothetical protein